MSKPMGSIPGSSVSEHHVLNGVGSVTARKDNTRVQRIKAIKVLTDQGWDVGEAMDMLGIPADWVLTADPDPTRTPAAGKRYKRNMYNGPARL